MFKYTKIGVNVISIIISIIFFLIVELFIFNQNFAFQGKKELYPISSNQSEKDIPNNNLQINKSTAQIEIKEENIESEWSIEIPRIGLFANIQEGTTQEVMNKYVGHFENTSKTIGNVGLAAHNRGFEFNYFANLKKIKEGDKIIYKYGKFQKEYIVNTHIIIEETNWEKLEKTEENTITLITCVENEPSYRRCVQGVEMSEQ